jgi:hypothetical protein
MHPSDVAVREYDGLDKDGPSMPASLASWVYFGRTCFFTVGELTSGPIR